jgi:hypothetical protein
MFRSLIGLQPCCLKPWRMRAARAMVSPKQFHTHHLIATNKNLSSTIAIVRTGL